jgi:hypothetical protein
MKKMRKTRLAIILLIAFSLMAAVCSGCGSLESLLQKGEEFLAEGETWQDSTAEEDAFPTKEDIDAVVIPEEERQYLTRYFNDGFSRGTGGYISYQDLHWDLEELIHPSKFAGGNNFDVVILGDSLYLQYFINVSQEATYKVYRYDLNTQELTCILDEEDFGPYVYQSTGISTWDTQMLKTDSSLVFVGAAKEWENILVYDTLQPELGLQYLGKYYPDQEEGYLSLLEWDKLFWNNGGGIYKAVARGQNNQVVTFEFSAGEGKAQNIKIYEDAIMSDIDVFYGEVDGEMINYYIKEVSTEDPITGATLRKSVLVKFNMDTGVTEEIADLPLLTILPETVESSALTSKYLVFRAGYPDKEYYIFDFTTKELTETFDTGFWYLMEKSYPTEVSE